MYINKKLSSVSVLDQNVSCDAWFGRFFFTTSMSTEFIALLCYVLTPKYLLTQGGHTALDAPSVSGNGHGAGVCYMT
jgi:hypothetical protein